MLIFTNVNSEQPMSLGSLAFARTGRFCYRPDKAVPAITGAIDWSNTAPSTGE